MYRLVDNFAHLMGGIIYILLKYTLITYTVGHVYGFKNQGVTLIFEKTHIF